MRHGTPNRRSRNNRGGHSSSGGGQRPHGGGNSGPNRSQVFDSNGPDVRIRGTAYQIQEKYMALAKDAASSGDRVMAESYLQHAEHYQRVINEWGIQAPRVEQPQQTDAFDRAFEGEQPQPQQQAQPQQQPPAQRPRHQPKSDDLGLPSSILGPKREVPKTELSDA
ncbi:MAG: hypothetical protein JWO78_2133 [Micavibrio sp.]|nr:hypothetical protein [Micavibrio sp.]